MGLFDSIKGAVGAGQPAVSIQFDSAEALRGGRLTGRATITGKERAMPLTAFDLQVVSVTQGVGRNTVHKDRIPMQGAMVQPGQSLEAPFELRLPMLAPSSQMTSYEVVLSADVPGMDPKTQALFTVLQEIDPLSAEDTQNYHVLMEPRTFRHSSVRGDFRLALLPDGFVAQWKTRVTCRNSDGSARWALDGGWGRTVSASPDGKRVATSDKNKRLVFVDAATGALGEPIQMPSWVDDVAFLADGTIVAGGHEALWVLDAEGQIVRTIDDLGYGTPYLSSLCAGPDRVVYVIDPNKDLVMAVDIDRGVVGQVNLRNPNTLHPSRDGSRLLIDGSDRIFALDGQLQVLCAWELPGKKGVRYVGQEKHSSTHWKSHPRISPSGSLTLLNDATGLLWLLDTATGRPHRSFDRGVLDYVEDSLFWDEQHFIAITNDGKVRGMRLDGTLMFEDQDA